MNKEAIKRRAKQAASLLKRIESVLKSMDKIPSFNGKAAFMDKILNVRTEAVVLESDLALDVKDANKPPLRSP